jgi:LPS-assembly lipoprotein
MVAMLKASKSTLAPSASDAGVVIKIIKEEMRNRVLSIGTTGKSTESEVDYYLRFQFFDKQDNPLMDEQTIEMAREFFNDQTAVLAKSNEEQLIKAEIYKQIARMLMARASVAVENQKK